MAKKVSARAVRKVLDELEAPEVFREPSKPIGRPRLRPRITDEAAVGLLCERLVSGLSMADACLDPRCPTQTDVYVGMAADPVFRSVIVRAREAQQHAIIDETVRMADDATEENWQVVKLRIWARQWRAGKLAPRIYGERTTIAGDPENPLVVSQAAETRAQLIARLEAMAKPEPLTIEGKAEKDG